ncbi:MAG TPA: hypothetical protein VHC22_08360 [Pirellulales bacterium]|nr:hypothetical protein [Pirellulales bacterium]
MDFRNGGLFVVQGVQRTSADDAVVIDETSVAFIGRWRGLVSTTNWEKGRIIHEWREALKSSGAAGHDYSDEAWSRRVGQVSGQHAGRLRRVYERFQDVRQSYTGLYWSHFQAAIDWSDAEMWLEGAVQNDWSVSEMRGRRWETLGDARQGSPSDEDAVEAEFDEDADPAAVAEVRDPEDGDEAPSASARERSRRDEDASDDDADDATQGVPFDADASDYPAESPSAPVRPFEHLPELPDDLAEAFESFKLAILHHKMADWRDVSRDSVLHSLDALKQLTQAPA